MEQLIKRILAVPINTLIMWKKFAYIKSILKKASEEDLEAIRPAQCAAFVCQAGILGISVTDIMGTDPIKKITMTIHDFFKSISQKWQNISSDDLLPLIIALMPTIDNQNDLYVRLQMLSYIYELEHGTDYIQGCIVTIMAALTSKDTLSIDGFFEVDLNDDYLLSPEEEEKNIADQLRIREMAKSFLEEKLTVTEQKNFQWSATGETKFFFSDKLHELIHNCVHLHEQIYRHKIYAMGDIRVYRTFKEPLEIMMEGIIKRDRGLYENYFGRKEGMGGNSKVFRQLALDYVKPELPLYHLAQGNIGLKKALENYGFAYGLMHAHSLKNAMINPERRGARPK